MMAVVLDWLAYGIIGVVVCAAFGLLGLAVYEMPWFAGIIAMGALFGWAIVRTAK